MSCFGSLEQKYLFISKFDRRGKLKLLLYVAALLATRASVISNYKQTCLMRKAFEQRLQFGAYVRVP